MGNTGNYAVNHSRKYWFLPLWVHQAINIFILVWVVSYAYSKAPNKGANEEPLDRYVDTFEDPTSTKGRSFGPLLEDILRVLNSCGVLLFSLLERNKYL